MRARSTLPWTFALLALVGGARGLGADEPPPPKPPAPPESPTKPPEGAPAAPGGEGSAPAAPAPAAPDKAEPGRPLAAWREIQKAATDPANRKPGLNYAEGRAREYLVAWEATKLEPLPEDLLALGQLLNAVHRTDDASGVFERGAALEALPKAQRAVHASLFASNALQAANAGTLKPEAAAVAAKRVDGWTSLAQGAALANLLNTLGYLHKASGQLGAAIEAWVAGAEAAHERAYGMADHVVGALVEDVHELEGFEQARLRAAPILARLRALQESALTEARKARDEEQQDAMKARRDQAFRSAESALTRIKDVDRPLRMLGTAAEEWTLVKAFGKGRQLADYRGKVVLVDFWATWCPWCIKSFPVLRDLRRDFGPQGLEVVGVTTSAATVYDQRYALDDDLKDKAAGASVQPVLKRPTAPAPAGDPAADNGSEAAADYERALAEFRAKEQEVLSTFIANHQMTWDVVEIDEQEPAPKYALTGWPHAVLIDRQGRVRHLHSGALLKDKPEKLAAFRKLIEDLLAEPAPAAPTK